MQSDIMDISGVPVLVTGGGKRIGKACVEALAQSHASVVIHYGSSKKEAEFLLTKIRKEGGKAAMVQGDLANPDEVGSIMQQAGQFFGPVQILLNSAAIFKPGLFKNTDLTQWHEHLNINLTAPFILMQEFAAQLPPKTPGKIINIIDQRIKRPRPGHIAYNTAKSGLWTLTQIAAQEMAPWIQVNAIAPGPILPAPDQPVASFEKVAKATPLGRPGSTDDIAQAVIFLIKQEYTTGEIIRVDGGEHLQ
ncbi:MAG: SDR family oxidoreductase [Magnetococcales bacterium]|nr:SDR family oxidoreductase [Magnetococcales bacterium]